MVSEVVHVLTAFTDMQFQANHSLLQTLIETHLQEYSGPVQLWVQPVEVDSPAQHQLPAAPPPFNTCVFSLASSLLRLHSSAPHLSSIVRATPSSKPIGFCYRGLYRQLTAEHSRLSIACVALGCTVIKARHICMRFRKGACLSWRRI